MVVRYASLAPTGPSQAQTAACEALSIGRCLQALSRCSFDTLQILQDDSDAFGKEPAHKQGPAPGCGLPIGSIRVPGVRHLAQPPIAACASWHRRAHSNSALMLLGQLRSITAQARRSLPCQSAFQASSQAPPASQAGAWTPAAAACRQRGPHRRAFSARELSLANERYRAWRAGRANGIAFVLAVKGETLPSMRSRSTVA